MCRGELQMIKTKRKDLDRYAQPATTSGTLGIAILFGTPEILVRLEYMIIIM